MHTDSFKIESLKLIQIQNKQELLSKRHNDASKEYFHFDGQVNKLSSFLFVLKFSKIENMFFVFLSSYRNTYGSLGEFKKAVQPLTCRLVFLLIQHFLFSQTSTIKLHCREPWCTFLFKMVMLM